MVGTVRICTHITIRTRPVAGVPRTGHSIIAAGNAHARTAGGGAGAALIHISWGGRRIGNRHISTLHPARRHHIARMAVLAFYICGCSCARTRVAVRRQPRCRSRNRQCGAEYKQRQYRKETAYTFTHYDPPFYVVNPCFHTLKMDFPIPLYCRWANLSILNKLFVI